MYLDQYPKRTIKQHNTEWLYYQIISDSTGHTPYEIYDNMSRRFLKVILEDGGLGIIRPTSLNTYHHNLYLLQVQAWAATYDIILPDPTTDPGEQYATKRL